VYISFRTAALAAAVCWSQTCVAQDTYSNQTLGFSITKPKSWHYVTAEQNKENLSRADFSDPKFKELVLQYARTPFFAITKYKEPHDDLNPSIKVNVREAGQLKSMPPEKIAELTSTSLARAFKDFALAEGPKAVTISGRPAGYFKANYTFEAGGSSWRTTSEMWIVPRGDLLFIIGAGLREDEKNGSSKELRSVVDTIKIQ
jgi:hypothetical protein